MKKCEVCGSNKNMQSKYKPKSYCSEVCRDYAKFKDALEKKLLKIKPTEEAKKTIRGDMFRLANLMSKSTITN